MGTRTLFEANNRISYLEAELRSVKKALDQAEECYSILGKSGKNKFQGLKGYYGKQIHDISRENALLRKELKELSDLTDKLLKEME